MFTITQKKSSAGNFIEMLNENLKIVIFDDGFCKAYDVKNNYNFLDFADSLVELFYKIS